MAPSTAECPSHHKKVENTQRAIALLEFVMNVDSNAINNESETFGGIQQQLDSSRGSTERISYWLGRFRWCRSIWLASLIWVRPRVISRGPKGMFQFLTFGLISYSNDRPGDETVQLRGTQSCASWRSTIGESDDYLSNIECQRQWPFNWPSSSFTAVFMTKFKYDSVLSTFAGCVSRICKILRAKTLRPKAHHRISIFRTFCSFETRNIINN